MKLALKKVLALLLILASILTVFASCASNEDSLESNSDTADGTDNILDGNVDENTEDGLINVFSNGQYTAKIIRGEMASAFEKEAKC